MFVCVCIYVYSHMLRSGTKCKLQISQYYSAVFFLFFLLFFKYFHKTEKLEKIEWHLSCIPTQLLSVFCCCFFVYCLRNISSYLV